MKPLGAEVQASGCGTIWVATAKKQTNPQRQPDKATKRMQTDEQRSVQKKRPKTRTGTDRKTEGPERDRNATGTTSPERTGNAFRAQARKTGTGPEQAKQQDRNATGTLEFSIDPPRAGPCRRSAPKPFRSVRFHRDLV